MFPLFSAILISKLLSTGLEVNCEVLPNPVVSTHSGLVQGTRLTSRNGRNFAAFLGIPYGKPPVGRLRFQAPVSIEPWGGILDGTKYGSVCPQPDFSLPDPTEYPPPSEDRKGVGDEDCLRLNVFSNGYFWKDDDNHNHSKNKRELLPVLVVIHRGWFMSGSGGYYGPRYFMDHDLILVTFNNRVGPFGFLSTESRDAPGNAGMKDQLLVLKWIQQNIKSFGGDPSRVTIYGQSSGSCSVQYHMLSPASQGLFSAGISSSLAAYKPYSHQLHPAKHAELFGEEMGCGNSDGDSGKLISCLRSKNAPDLAAHSDEFLEVIKNPLKIFAPSTERAGLSSEPFSFMDPYPAMISGAQRRVPWLVGMNSGEGLPTTLPIYQDDNLTQWVDSEWLTKLGAQLLVYDKSLTNRTEALSKFYLSSYRTDGVIDIRKDFVNFTNIFSDRLHIHPLITTVKFQSQLSPVFLYYNDYMTEKNELKLGTLHGEELPLLFSPPDLNGKMIEAGDPDYEQSKLMVDLFVQFVTNPYNMSYKNQSWNPVGVSITEHGVEHKLNCFLFENEEDGEQGTGTFPKSVEDRLTIWNKLGIPPYQEKNAEW